MAIRLISESERFKREIQGAVFDLRRAPMDLIARWKRKHTKRGVLDEIGMLRDIMCYCILGWDDKVAGDDGSPADCTNDHKMKLPEAVMDEISTAVREDMEGKGDEDPS